MNKEKRQKPYFFRRVIAYLIDILLVASLSGAVRLLVNKDANNNTYMKEYTALIEKYNQKEITEEEFNYLNNELYYNNNLETADMSIIMCGVSLIYYVILCYYCHGITLGKYLMKLKIESANEKELNMGNYLLRSLFINMILSYLLSVLCVQFMNKDTFLSIYPKVGNVLSIFLLVTLLFIMYREDGRGLHDLIANTKIVSTKVAKEDKKPKDIVEEAKVIEEKQLADKKKERKKKKEVKKK